MMYKWELDLIRDISVGINFADQDHPRGRTCTEEITLCNRVSLLKYFSRIKNNCRAILEIGVYRNGGASFTQALLENKLPQTIYLGVDIEDRSYVDDPSQKIYTIKTSSSNVDDVMKYARSIGITEFDFIFIDGDHSIKQVMCDWEYTQWLSHIGIVGFHDTAYHYGPNYFVHNLKTDIWNVIPNACQHNEDDYGIGFAWKKNDVPSPVSKTITSENNRYLYIDTQ